MMKNTVLKCLVADDETIAAEGIVAYIDKLDFLEPVAVCASAIEAADILRSTEIDLMFLDINMPHLSGLDFLESLVDAPLAILTTAYSEYALDSYRLGVIDYLLKPIGFKRFFQAAAKAQAAHASRLAVRGCSDGEPGGMYVRQGDAFKRIEWNHILYAEGMQNYVKLHFKNETLVIHQTMASLEDMLPSGAFFRIHRSYLVNISRIESVSGNRLFIDGRELPVSGQRMRELLNTVVYKNLISK